MLIGSGATILMMICLVMSAALSGTTIILSTKKEGCPMKKLEINTQIYNSFICNYLTFTGICTATSTTKITCWWASVTLANSGNALAPSGAFFTLCSLYISLCNTEDGTWMNLFLKKHDRKGFLAHHLQV